MAITVFFNSYLYQIDLKLPFLTSIYEIERHIELPLLIKTITLSGISLILFTRHLNFGSAFITIGILLAILGCKPCYSDSRVYTFCIFFLLTFYNRDIGTRFLRLQIIILYMGTGVNKLLDPDWQTGLYIDNWLLNKIEHPIYLHAATIFDNMILAMFLSWCVISIEILIALCFTNKKLFGIGILLGISLHTGTIFSSNGVFGAFIISVFISYLVFIEWPKEITIIFPKRRIMDLLIKNYYLIDPFKKIHFKSSLDSKKLEIHFNDKIFNGWKAFQYSLIFSPISYFTLLGLFIFPDFGFTWIKGVLIILGTSFVVPILIKDVENIFYNK